MIPFFVVDRPASLRIIAGLNLPFGRARLGLMTHANTTGRFETLFRDFPCGEPEYCRILNDSRRHPEGKCATGAEYARRFVKMGDSGAFTREGCQFSDYESLFQKYNDLGVSYGVIIDYLKDPKRTIESAAQAIEVYRRNSNRNFKLAGVAQGNSVSEYIECYAALKKLGFEHIAVGGLLRKKENSKRFVHVRDESLMYAVIRSLRRRYPNDWLFALGAYHPKRHNRFEALDVWGGDYKGWIFHYPKAKEVHPRRWHDRRRYRAVRDYIEREVVRRATGETGNRNLLVLGCSKAKTNTTEPLPAIERYDGPTFRMVRKMFFDGLHLDVDLAVLSGKYGFLQPSSRIPNYDFRLLPGGPPPAEAGTWRQDLLKQVGSRHYKEVFLAMGPDYRRALGELHVKYGRTKFQTSEGTNGTRLAQTKRWIISKSNRAT